MERFGMRLDNYERPVLDKSFIPFIQFVRAYMREAREPVAIALHGPGGQIFVYETFIRSQVGAAEVNKYYLDRLVKLLLWAVGAYRVTVCGPEPLHAYIADQYSAQGAHAFDDDFFQCIYDRPFEVRCLPYENRPTPVTRSDSIGRHVNGCRIGFDAGGSDRKVSAVINGEAVFTEETVWHPKTAADPAYHYEGILDSLKKAAGHMPRVDAIGISSAGVYVDNRTKVASLFRKVPKELFDAQVKDIYLRAAKEFGDVPVVVCNDGDVSALAGSMYYQKNNMLGLAMGTSTAAGYVDEAGNIKGWLSELAFVPIDLQACAPIDEWSGDAGCGTSYFSQDAAIRLSEAAGIRLDAEKSPAEKLKCLQDMLSRGEQGAISIFQTIGCYLGHTAPLFHMLYGCTHILLQGRVMSGEGGNIITEEAKRVLSADYPELTGKVELILPDEAFRRLGQSVIAASLPAL